LSIFTSFSSLHKNQARHFGQEFFFQRFLIRSIKKNQGDIFWEFDFEQTGEKSKKILLVLFLKKFTIMA